MKERGSSGFCSAVHNLTLLLVVFCCFYAPSVGEAEKGRGQIAWCDAWEEGSFFSFFPT